MTTLVTGASGFIGLNVLEHLLSQGRDVIAFSHDTLPSAAQTYLLSLPGQLHVVRGDISNAADVRALFSGRKVTHVVHAAAITAGANTPATQVEHVLRVNVMGTQRLLQAAHDAGVSRFLLTSSSAVHGDAPFEDHAVDEHAPTRPLGLYGYTKLATEQLANLFHEQHGLDIVIARLTAIFGPWERDTGVRSTLSPPFQLAVAALQQRAVRLAAGGRRDWTLSTDIAAGLGTLLFAPAPQHRLYNLASGTLWHPSLLCDALQKEFPSWHWETAPGDQSPNIDYNDDLTRPRVSPMLGQRYSDEFQTSYTLPHEAARRYAAWVRTHANFLSPN